MSSALGSALAVVEQGERASATRHLLGRPLTLRRHDPHAFAVIVRHRHTLARWFADHTGWKLLVEPAAGFARLYKVVTEPDASHPVALSGKPAFDRRRYTLLCLTLVVLDDTPVQTTLVRVAQLLADLSRGESEIVPFNPDSFAERRALVDVLRWLEETGVLQLRDGDAERYARSHDGDALYDVNDRLLGQLVAAPVPPALAANTAHMMVETYSETEEGQRQRARHRVTRALLDDPVVYYEDLAERELEWLDHSRGFLYRLLEKEVGLAVERRKEGMGAVDPEGRMSDTLFPDGGSTAKHAALLLAEQLTSIARGQRYIVLHEEVISLVGDLIESYGERCHWSKQYLGEDNGARLLAGDAMRLLEAFHLVRSQDNGYQLRPALARFAPSAPPPGT